MILEVMVVNHCHLESCWGLGSHHWGKAETGRLLLSFVDSRHGWGRRCRTILKKKKAKDEKVYLQRVAHWRRYAVGLVVLPFPGEVEAGDVTVVE